MKIGEVRVKTAGLGAGRRKRASIDPCPHHVGHRIGADRKQFLHWLPLPTSSFNSFVSHHPGGFKSQCFFFYLITTSYSSKYMKSSDNPIR